MKLSYIALYFKIYKLEQTIMAYLSIYEKREWKMKEEDLENENRHIIRQVDRLLLFFFLEL